MKSKCNKNAIEIVGLRRPTALDKLADAISKPSGAIPKFGLPKWKVMPLESKIPMVPGPEGAYNFARRKIGKKLWVSASDAEFNLSDPYCYEMKLDYDPLHDKHLVPFLSKPRNIGHLMKAGLITNDLYAKCSLRDYNMYRKYLRKLHCDSVKKELRRRSKLCDEERAIRFAEQQFQKEIKRLTERERLMEASKNVIEKRELAMKLKQQKQKEKQEQIQRRLELLARTKETEMRSQRAQRKARADSIQEKLKAAADIARHKVIKTLLDWNFKEHVRRKTRDMRLARERYYKRQIVEQKWKAKQEFQKGQIQKEQFLLKCINSRREKFINEYNEKIARETKRMQRLLEKMKIFMRCYMARRMPGGKERICCKKYMENNTEDASDGIQKLCIPKPHPTSIKQERSKANKTQIKQVKGDKTQQSTKQIVKSKTGNKPNTKGGKIKLRKRESFSESDTKESPSGIVQETMPVSNVGITSESLLQANTVYDKCRCQMIKLTK